MSFKSFKYMKTYTIFAVIGIAAAELTVSDWQEYPNVPAVDPKDWLNCVTDDDCTGETICLD